MSTHLLTERSTKCGVINIVQSVSTTQNTNNAHVAVLPGRFLTNN